MGWSGGCPCRGAYVFRFWTILRANFAQKAVVSAGVYAGLGEEKEPKGKVLLRNGKFSFSHSQGCLQLSGGAQLSSKGQKSKFLGKPVSAFLLSPLVFQVSPAQKIDLPFRQT